MGILYWILLGLIVGALARLIVPGKQPGGIIVTIILGIVGAFLGGWIGTLLGLGSVNGFNLTSILLATGGAIIIILIYNALKKK
ncbi:MAG: GlsB/YeaQ/YmgE family stress response membrane protein [Prolixibacteraceae bacterium]|jgi:uncharacterized membrane protein YeaQ/YmgE (transglycosylase-associated protein family)|nr:GlsB/YeaQ/YmgE family stress response membrane protein [Prolixibacteraceae bacterium]MDI9564494.1 GlsB/YeaQ/YmgE family stress response membrane protein [Bacteroidota bacterium]NLS98948.1 GlsB/YeaQ/YmgE family stress response membrane protein [Bacteroidales bacterium]OQB79784.1 MAG: hypothetical protein BWX87_01930 [Bacteroidetes bacterium ADurb.Bin123]HNU76728.1 GlsB/YeaQ/YmgE family stress response membrane protein [Prolixibacteraceae bacterium]